MPSISVSICQLSKGIEVVLQLRIYAMYGQNRAVLILMGVTFVIVKIWVLILLGFFSASVKGKYMHFHLPCALTFSLATSNPIHGMANFCVQLSRWPYYYLYWAPLLFLEALLFSLALYKGYKCYRDEDKTTAHLSRTMNFLVKGSVWYFLTLVYPEFLQVIG